MRPAGVLCWCCCAAALLDEQTTDAEGCKQLQQQPAAAGPRRSAHLPARVRPCTAPAHATALLSLLPLASARTCTSPAASSRTPRLPSASTTSPSRAASGPSRSRTWRCPTAPWTSSASPTDTRRCGRASLLTRISHCAAHLNAQSAVALAARMHAQRSQEPFNARCAFLPSSALRAAPLPVLTPPHHLHFVACHRLRPICTPARCLMRRTLWTTTRSRRTSWAGRSPRSTG